MWLNNRARLEVQYIRNYDHHWHDHCQVEYQQSRILRSWPLIIITAIGKNGESYPAVIGTFCRGWCDDVLDLQAWHGIVVARSCHLKWQVLTGHFGHFGIILWQIGNWYEPALPHFSIYTIVYQHLRTYTSCLHRPKGYPFFFGYPILVAFVANDDHTPMFVAKRCCRKLNNIWALLLTLRFCWHGIFVGPWWSALGDTPPGGSESSWMKRSQGTHHPEKKRQAWKHDWWLQHTTIFIPARNDCPNSLKHHQPVYLYLYLSHISSFVKTGG